MEQLRELVKTTQHEQVRMKTLELIQAWAYAFRSNPKYHAVQETVTIMKAEGYKFPALKESDAMFSADTAPEWVDASVCHRCRVSFGVVQRKVKRNLHATFWKRVMKAKFKILYSIIVEHVAMYFVASVHRKHQHYLSLALRRKFESVKLVLIYITSKLFKDNQ